MYLELHKFPVTPDECKMNSKAFIDFIQLSTSEHMWISLDDIETLELTYRGSQWRGHTPKNTFRPQSLQGFPDQEGSRWAGGCSDGPHSWENLNLAGHFFRYGWSASVMWDGQRCREAPTVSEHHQRRRASGGKWPAIQSGPVCHPQYPRPVEITATLSQILLKLSQRTSVHTLTFPASQIPSQGHIVAPAGQDWEGG